MVPSGRRRSGGGCPALAQVKVCAPVVEYWPALVPMDGLDHVVVTADGTRTPVKDTPVRAPVTGQRPSDDAPPVPDLGPTRRAPLGALAEHNGRNIDADIATLNALITARHATPNAPLPPQPPQPPKPPGGNP